MIGQTATLLLDAYRELNARKLFWIALGLSGIVVIAFAMIGVNAEGNVIFLTFDLGIPIGSFGWGAADLYKLIFVQFGIGFWLAWLTTILALVTTASIFPDLITSGSIDLVLSKPIGRWRLFLTKYATGLLFVTLQVGVFSGACFLLIGIRGGAWEPALFIAVPVVVVFYSYLFSVCTLFGLWTRSTLTALILTLLFWFVVWAFNASDQILLTLREQQGMEVRQIERNLANLEADHAEAESDDDPGLLDSTRNGLRERNIESMRTRLEDEQKTYDAFNRWSGRIVTAKTIMPKTSETIDLLNRWLIDLADLPDLTQTDFDGDRAERARQQALEDAAEGDEIVIDTGSSDADNLAVREMRKRSVAWVAGTSLAFEGFVLLLAGWTFSRRDF